MAEVPPELITEILLFSSVKTLLRFRCISKSLHYIIDSPNFIKLHSSTNFKNRSHRKIIFRNPYGVSPFNPVRVADIDDPFPPYLNLPSIRIGVNVVVAHCNGLVLFGGERYRDRTLVVWNPSTRKCRELPILPNYHWPMEYCIHLGWSLGYDSSADDYKILLLKLRYSSNSKNKMEIWVFGLRSGYWRMIGNLSNNIDVIIFSNYINLTNLKHIRNCFVDGSFHFVCDKHLVFAFDLAKETFSRVYLPHFLPKLEETNAYNLHVLEECLCISFFLKREEVEFMELYSRKKNGEGEFSWTKLFSIECNGFSRMLNSAFHLFWKGELLGFSKRGDKIFSFCRQDLVVLSYDLREKEIEMIAPTNGYEQDVSFCIESLVSVDYPDIIKENENARRNRKERRSLLKQRRSLRKRFIRS